MSLALPLTLLAVNTGLVGLQLWLMLRSRRMLDQASSLREEALQMNRDSLKMQQDIGAGLAYWEKRRRDSEGASLQ